MRLPEGACEVGNAWFPHTDASASSARSTRRCLADVVGPFSAYVHAREILARISNSKPFQLLLGDVLPSVLRHSDFHHLLAVSSYSVKYLSCVHINVLVLFLANIPEYVRSAVDAETDKTHDGSMPVVHLHYDLPRVETFSTHFTTLGMCERLTNASLICMSSYRLPCIDPDTVGTACRPSHCEVCRLIPGLFSP